GSDFNGDGYQDLAVGISGRDVVVQGITQNEAGAVQVWSGSATGLVRGKMWTKQSKGVRGKSIDAEHWGSQTETGDFNGDGYADLVVTSSPGRALSILYGSATGLTADADQLITVPGLVLGITEGDFDGDGRADLAVGSSEPSGLRSAHAWYGSASGLDPSSEEAWDQDTPGVPDVTDT